MVKVPFDVNNQSVRDALIHVSMFQALEALSHSLKPGWGRMTAQQMVEHLLWAVEVSNGTVIVECKVNPRLVERFKTFLYDNTPTSHEFMNPVLKNGLPQLRCRDVTQAVGMLRDQVDAFAAAPADGTGPLRVHPVFGPLGKEEWSRAHFKHFCHHLLQFGLIEVGQATAEP